jgi:hemolysin activation/secretion protein
MGTDFFLFNSTLVRRIVRLPLLGNFNLPYVDLNWQVFGDAAKTFDRARVFQQGKLLVDVGGGFKIDMPRTSLNLTYGRSLRDGQAVWSAYLEKRW